MVEFEFADVAELIPKMIAAPREYQVTFVSYIGVISDTRH
jgi:hypothetical protein